MNKKNFTYVLLFFMLVVASYFFLTQDQNSQNVQNEMASTQHSHPQHQALVAKQSEQLVNEIKENDSVELHDKAYIKILRSNFQKLHKLRTHLSKDQARKEIMNNLLENPKTPQLAMLILLDLDFTRKFFEEDQAIARIYAIALLRQLADEGNSEPLEQSAQKLSIKLSKQLDVSQGEWRDLEDLIIHVIEIRDPDLVSRNIDDLVSKLSYSPKVRDAFNNAFYFAFRKTLADSELEKLML